MRRPTRYIRSGLSLLNITVFCPRFSHRHARATHPVSLSYRTFFLCSTARGYHRRTPSTGEVSGCCWRHLTFPLGYEPRTSVFWLSLPLSALHAHSKDTLSSLWCKVNCWFVFVTINKMPNTFSGFECFFVLSHAIIDVKLTAYALEGSLLP